jgi:hypothetical protein
VDQQQSGARAGAQIPHARTLAFNVERYPVLLDGEFVLWIDACVQWALHGDFLLAMRQLFLGSDLLYKSIASVAFVRESFGSPLFFLNSLWAQCVGIEERDYERPGVGGGDWVVAGAGVAEETMVGVGDLDVSVGFACIA